MESLHLSQALRRKLEYYQRERQAPQHACVRVAHNIKDRFSLRANVILVLRAIIMEAGKDACMLQFNSDAKLTSEEFVKVFKEFDKDGKN